MGASKWCIAEFALRLVLPLPSVLGQDLGGLVDVGYEEVEAEDDSRSAIVSNSVLAPHNAGDIIVAQCVAWLISRKLTHCETWYIDKSASQELSWGREVVVNRRSWDI